MDIQFMKDYYDLRYEETDEAVRKHHVCLFRYGRDHQTGRLFAGGL